MYAAWYLYAESQWRQAMDRARALGEPIWFSDLAPPPMAPEDDAAPLLIALFDKLRNTMEIELARQRVEERLRRPPAAVGAMDAPLASDSEPTVAEDLATLRAWFAQAPTFWTDLDAALARPGYYPPRIFDSPWPDSFDVSIFQHVGHLTQYLRARCHVAIIDGELETALRSIESLLRLAQQLETDSSFSMYFTRANLVEAAMTCLRSLMSREALTDEQRRRLDVAFSEVPDGFRMAPMMMWSRCETMSFLKIFQEERDGGFIYKSAIFRPLWFQEEAYVLELGRNAIQLVDRDGPGAIVAEQQLDVMVAAIPRQHAGLPNLRLLSSDIPLRFRRSRQKWHNARLALRVDAWRRAHGTWPPSLAAVCDEALPRVPGDLFTGAQPILQTGPTSFTIYSLGTNGRDDGGPGSSDPDERHTAFTVDYGDFLPMGDSALAPAADPLAP